MEILTELLGAGASAASGGVFGLVGALTGGVFKYFKAKQEHQFQKDTWAHEKDLLEMQRQGRQDEWEHEAAMVAQEGSWSALGESLKKQGIVGESYRWVNAVKDLWRPFLTAALLVLTWDIFRSTKDPELVKYIVYSVVFAASTAVMFWFADRALAPPGAKNR